MYHTFIGGYCARGLPCGQMGLGQGRMPHRLQCSSVCHHCPQPCQLLWHQCSGNAQGRRLLWVGYRWCRQGIPPYLPMLHIGVQRLEAYRGRYWWQCCKAWGAGFHPPQQYAPCRRAHELRLTPSLTAYNTGRGTTRRCGASAAVFFVRRQGYSVRFINFAPS